VLLRGLARGRARAWRAGLGGRTGGGASRAVDTGAVVGLGVDSVAVAADFSASSRAAFDFAAASACCCCCFSAKAFCLPSLREAFFGIRHPSRAVGASTAGATSSFVVIGGSAAGVAGVAGMRPEVTCEVNREVRSEPCQCARWSVATSRYCLRTGGTASPERERIGWHCHQVCMCKVCSGHVCVAGPCEVRLAAHLTVRVGQVCTASSRTTSFLTRHAVKGVLRIGEGVLSGHGEVIHVG
jgi:hypothetical protein